MAKTDNKRRRENLSAAKKALLEKRLKSAHQGQARQFTIPHQPPEKPRLLSSAQERIWFLGKMEPDLTAYNRPLALRLSGPLDHDILRSALQEILQRHEVLRWRYSTHHGSALVQIDPHPSLDYQIVKIEHNLPSERVKQAISLAAQDAQRPFDLAADIPLRVRVYCLGDSDHILSIIFHHIAFDAWSARIFVRELAVLYETNLTGKEVVLSEPQIQYGDYAAWQRGRLAAGELEHQLTYWKAKLANLPPPLDLPTAKRRPNQQTYFGANTAVEITPKLLAALKSLVQSQGATLFMALLGVFQTLLFRYSGQSDVVVGTPVTDRTLLETETLIGMFINTLVMRLDLSGDPDFIEVLARAKRMSLEATTRRELPFETLVEVLNPERDAGRTPLFQVLFNLENLEKIPVYQAGDLRIEAFDFDDGNAQFDLSLEITHQDNGMVCTFNYNTDLFDGEIVASLAGHYLNLLEGVVADPQAKIRSLPLMGEAEQRQILFGWNQTQIDFPSLDCVQRLFERQVKQTPHAPALVFGDQVLSYSQLNERANRLAHYLQRVGVGPEVLVGICIPRSLDLVVAIYGVLKAGGAYIPLDSTYPARRLAFMLSDANPAVLLTHQDLAAEWDKQATKVVCLDTDWPDIADESAENPRSQATLENLAYLIYTSGSTGAPKGVLIPHRALSNHVAWMQEVYPLDSGDKVLQKTPVSFDASIWEFFAPLVVGAQLVMADPLGHMNVGYLLETIIQQRITILQMVPSVLGLLTEDVRFPKCTSLRRLMCGGEAMTIALAESVFKALDVDLVNLYGPAESCVDAASYLVNRSLKLPIVPIGRPISNVNLYILGENQYPLPVGVAGELYISGSSVGRGYLKRPKLTAERFIPDPFISVDQGDEGNRVMYRSGDLARYLPDGNVEFLGRIDDQVKVNGARIELGEIENLIGGRPEVRQAVVVAQEYGGNTRLAAYVLLHPVCSLTEDTLRSYLKIHLPAYMIPSFVVFVDELPLSPSGKLNRSALPAVDTISLDGRAEYIAPSTPVERALAHIWSDILNVERIGLGVDFFSLGGHSLVAMRLIARVNDLFLTNLSLRIFFDAPTIEGLAAALATNMTAGTDRLDRRAEVLLKLARMTDAQAQEMLDKYNNSTS